MVECHFETEPEGFVEFCALRVLEETAAAERAARDHAHKEKLRREHEAEAAAERDFRELSKKYRARWTPQDALLGPLHQVNLRLDEGGLLTGNDLSWLKQQKQYGPLALTLERSFAAGGDPWELVKAASFWRKAEEPERALALLADFQADESRLRAAALTARGAAYEDLGNHAHAAADAELAVSLAPTAFHPHNLLGRIYYARGLPGAGDRHFDRAEELGSSARDSEQTRKVAVRQTTGQTRREIASYLLAKDPERYAWVRQYLGDVTAEK